MAVFGAASWKERNLFIYDECGTRLIKFTAFPGLQNACACWLRRCSDCSFAALPASLTPGLAPLLSQHLVGRKGSARGIFGSPRDAMATHRVKAASTLRRPRIVSRPSASVQRVPTRGFWLPHRTPACGSWPLEHTTAESLHGSHTKPRTSRRGLREWRFYLFSARLAQGQPGVRSCTHLSSAWYELSLKTTAIERATPSPPSPSLADAPLRRCAGGMKKKRDASCDARPPPRPAVAQAPHWPALTISRGTRGQTPPCT